MSERDALERQLDDLRAFEREYRTRLIAFHRDKLAELAGEPFGDVRDISREVSRIARLARSGDRDAALSGERHLYMRVLALSAAGRAGAAGMATAALAAAQIKYPEATDAH